MNTEQQAGAGSASSSTRLFGGLGNLERTLVRHGVIHRAAIEDAEGFDGGATQERILRTFEDLCAAMWIRTADRKPETFQRILIYTERWGRHGDCRVRMAEYWDDAGEARFEVIDNGGMDRVEISEVPW